jgi:hypothetical protein
MNKKIQYGQFYTTNSTYIIGNLIDDLPKDLVVIEPFCGRGDLLIFENKYEIYDIDPKIKNCQKRDTLIDPPNYKGKLVITNPPFLSKNKNKEKTIYDLYNVGDLYKASIKSILECEGGILIVPLNFLCDEDINIRNLFFDNFNIIQMNIFEETVFNDTTYTICSFSFKRRIDKVDEDVIKINFFPSGKKTKFKLKRTTGWRIGTEFIELISDQKNIGITRLVNGKKPNSNLYLRAIDTGTKDGMISLMMNENHFYGKESDRTFATIILDREYTYNQQTIICNEFNSILNKNREKYNSLFLTNYRNSTSSYPRKRISFDVAYKLISWIIENKKIKNTKIKKLLKISLPSFF